MSQRLIRWPIFLAALILAASALLLMNQPQILSSAATRVVNRQLQAYGDMHLRVDAYRIRPFEGIDLLGVTWTRRGESGDQTAVAVDTVQVDFRFREVLGRSVTLRRLAMRGVMVFHRQGRSRETGVPATALQLPGLAIEYIDLQDGRIQISNSEGRLRELIQDVHWRGGLELLDDGLSLVVRSGKLDWSTRNARLDRVYGSAAIDRDGVHVPELSAAWNQGQASVKGSLGTEGLDLEASGRNISAEEIDDLVGLDLGFDARGDIDCAVASYGDTVRFRGRFSGRLADWDLHEVEGEAVIAHGLADFTTLRGGVGGAWFDGSLQVDERTDPQWAVITMNGWARDLDLRAGLIPDAPDLPHTGGEGRLNISYDSRDETTLVQGLLVDGFIEFMPFDSCRVDVWARGDSLRFNAVELHRAGIAASMSGASDRHEVFRGELALTVADLGQLPPDWQWPLLRGRGEGRIVLGGPLDELGASGRLSLKDFKLGPVSTHTTEVDLKAERILGDDWSLDSVASGEGIALGGIPLGHYNSVLRADARSVALDSFRTVHGDTVLDVVGRADLQPDRTGLHVERLHLGLGDNHWHADRPVTSVVGPGFWHLPHLNLVSGQGQLSASVDYQQDAEILDGRLELRNINLDILDAFLDWPMRTQGRISARLEAAGRPAEPTLELQGVLRDAVFPLARVDSLVVAGSLMGGTVNLDSVVLASDHGLFGLRGTVAHPGVGLIDFWHGAQLDVLVDVRNGSWAFLQQFDQPAFERIDGRFDGSLHLGGTTDDPLLSGEIDSAPFQFAWLSLERLTGSIRADAAQLALGNLRGRYGTMALEGRLEIPLRFDLLSEPVTPPDGPFHGYLRIPAGTDLGPLMHVTQAFSRSSGRGEAELTVSGPLSRPRYQGRLAADRLEIVIRDTEEVYSDGRISGHFTDDTLHLEEIRGRAGLRGSFEGQGKVYFEGLELRTWDIAFRADRFLVASIPDLRVLVRTRNGRLTGEAVGPERRLVPRFSGDYELIRGRYTGNFTAGAGAQDPTLGTIAPDWLADLRVTGAPRTMRIINRTMELDLSGDVSLVRDADGMVLSGAMDIDTGRLPIFNNTFKVVRGSLDFSREVGVVPNVDIDAETRVRLPSQVGGYSVVERLTVHASGPADAMTIAYSSESGYPREAVERMLLGLSPFPDEQGDQAAFTSASIGAGLNLIEREIATGIARGIGLFDTFEIDQIQRQQIGAAGLDPLIGVGKYLGTDLYIKYAQGLNQNDSDLIIEYQITDHLLLQTERRRRFDEYQGDATYSLDLKYRVEY